MMNKQQYMEMYACSCVSTQNVYRKKEVDAHDMKELHIEKLETALIETI